MENEWTKEEGSFKLRAAPGRIWIHKVGIVQSTHESKTRLGEIALEAACATGSKSKQPEAQPKLPKLIKAQPQHLLQLLGQPLGYLTRVRKVADACLAKCEE